MYRRYYDGYNTYPNNQPPKPKAENGEVVVPQTVESSGQDIQADDCVAAAAVHTAGRNGTGLSDIFGRLEPDDILLIGVIVLLLLDSANDTLLIAVLAVVLIAGWLD
ncbi:MAG: hypothetical protein E7409_05410 [Ruminococcaceae bacterium]|nr:hypothetical protein [Oscillospiraceae bacterium]